MSLFRKSLTALFRTGSDGFKGAVPELLAGPHRAAFERAAFERACAQRSVPLDGERWPACERLWLGSE